MKDALDQDGIWEAIRNAGLDLPERPHHTDLGDRLVNVFLKCEADPTGKVRGRRNAMLDDSDVSWHRQIKATVGGVDRVGDRRPGRLRVGGRGAPGPVRRRPGGRDRQGLSGPPPGGRSQAKRPRRPAETDVIGGSDDERQRRRDVHGLVHRAGGGRAVGARAARPPGTTNR